MTAHLVVATERLVDLLSPQKLLCCIGATDFMEATAPVIAMVAIAAYYCVIEELITYCGSDCIANWKRED